MPAHALPFSQRQIVRALLSLASATLLVRVLGMVNQIVVTSRFGAGSVMDVYFIAVSFPLLVSTIIVDGMESSVIPVFSRVRVRRSPEETSRLFSTLANICCFAAAALTLLLLVFRRQVLFLSAPALALDPLRFQLALSLMPFVVPSVLLMIMIGLAQAVLNAEGQFGRPAYAAMLVPLSTVVLVVVIGRSVGIVILAIGTLIGLTLQLVFLVACIRRAKFRYRLALDVHDPDVRAVFIAIWPMIVSASLVLTNPFVDQIFASFLSAGSISALNYALKLVSVPVGIVFVSVANVALPHLSRQAARGDMQVYKATVRLYLWAIGAATLVLSAVMFAFAPLIVRILFQHGAFTAEDTARTASTLRGFVVGLTPMALGFILPRALSALGKNRLLMYVAIFSLTANAVLDAILAKLWQSTGIALATSTVYFCATLIIFFLLRREVGKMDVFTPPPGALAVVRKVNATLFRK